MLGSFITHDTIAPSGIFFALGYSMSQIKLVQHPRMTLRCYLQHYLNPLHFYCRLRDWGVSSHTASRLCSRYEKFYRALSRGEFL